MSVRVPTPTVSIVDLVCLVKKETSVEEINRIFEKEANDKKWDGIFRIEKKPLVSSDYIGDSFSSILDFSSTKVIGNLVKLMSWYDNETGYSHQLANFAEYLGKNI